MKKLIFIILILISLFSVCQKGTLAQDIDSMPENIDYETGKVVKILSEERNKVLESSMGENQTVQRLKVKVLSGENKGKIFETENQLTSNPAYDIDVKPGDRVILDVEKNNDKKVDVFIADKERLPALMIITGLFLSLLLFVGGIKGLKSIISLAITSSLVIFIFIPAVLNDYPIFPITIIVALISTICTMFIVGGFNLKSTAATIGTIGGVTLSGLISILIIKIAPLSGLTDQESIILWSSRPDLDFTSLLVSAMIIGSLGAIMDVGISIASTVEQVKNANNSLTIKELIASGMNVGKDIMGAMSNTLILAYIGSSISLILLAANVPLIKLINLNSIVTEITAALSGSIGIILCVPITAVVAGYLIGYKRNKNNSQVE